MDSSRQRRAGLALCVCMLAALQAGCGGGAVAPAGAGAPAVSGSTDTSTAIQQTFRRFDDPAVGLSGGLPDGWYRARSISTLVEPREVLALATYPLRASGEVGECAPGNARADMPPDGVFIWLLEERPLLGDVWASLDRSRFPAKPARFHLSRADLERNDSCFPGPGHTTTFAAADRPFQLLVVFGSQPTQARLDTVNRILDSLEFAPLPPPPPDPYAGWTLINDNPGDSLRPPPGWPSAAGMFQPATTPRPRTMFFASNRPLPGLPARPVPYVDSLPGPWPPTAALDALPPDGVLVWVVEENSGPASGAFPQIDRGWPRVTDVVPSAAPTDAPSSLQWLRAGGAWMSYRFAIWVVAGPDASSNDRAFAVKSVMSLAVSGCSRDAVETCPEGD
jgi:hypothetical protein